MNEDPFVFPPQVWFSLLCHGVITDNVGRINVQAVFNQVLFVRPPEETGIQAHAHLQGLLAVGLTGGEGHFEATIQLRDVDDKVIWERPEGKWTFDLGLGEKPSVFLLQQLNQWLSEPGRYHYWVGLSPGRLEIEIPFEVAGLIGPVRVQGDFPPDPSGGKQ